MYMKFQTDYSTGLKERKKNSRKVATKNFYLQNCCKLNNKKDSNITKKVSKMKYRIENTMNDDHFILKKKKCTLWTKMTKYVDFSRTKQDIVQLVCHQLRYTNQIQKLHL